MESSRRISVFGVRTFRFGKLVFDLGVAGHQVHLIGALDEYLAVDQLVEDAELQRKRLFLRRLGGFTVDTGHEDFIYVLAEDFLAVDHGPDVRPRRRFLPAGTCERTSRHRCED
jgi:hypothetical protein